MTQLRILAPLTLGLVIACGGRDDRAAGRTGGTVVIAAFAEPQTLIPQLTSSTAGKQIVDQLFDKLADIPSNLNTIGDKDWTGKLARSWTWGADSMSIAFHLDPRAKWHDGVPVGAADVKSSLELFKDPKVGSWIAEAFTNVDSVSVKDSLTAVVWFRRRSPEQFYQIAFNLTVTPEHMLRGIDPSKLAESDFGKHPVGSGPFRFVEWTPRQSISLAANTEYFLGRPNLDRLVWSMNEDAGAAMRSMFSGEADLIEVTNPQLLRQVDSMPNVRMLPYRSLNYGDLIFNAHDPAAPARPHALFESRALRRALTMALDRNAMLRNYFDTLGVVPRGPFSSYAATADTTIPQVAYDTAGAARMLDSLGWRDANHDGVRERNGVPLRFSVMTTTSSTPRMRYAVLLQDQWRRVGAHVDVEAVAFPVFAQRMDAGKFDAFLMSWGPDPTPSGVAQEFHSGPRSTGNFGHYADPRLDAVIDSATTEVSVARAHDLYHRAYRLIVDDAPVVLLYESRVPAIVHKRLHTVVDRSNDWWHDIRLWTIASNERLPRDNLGLPPSTSPARDTLALPSTPKPAKPK